jgi:hypothetical protein
MIKITREEFKNDSVFRKLYETIKSNHKVAKHTEQVLIKNKHIKDFCEESTHFAPGKTSLFVHYEVASWYSPKKGGSVIIRIESIAVYDNFIEYQIARSKITEGYTLN